NLSHVSLPEAEGLVEALWTATRRSGREARLLIDMQGPELRVGRLPEPLRLREGERLPLSALPLPEALRKELHPGQELLLDDGKLRLRLETAEALRVLRGGELQSRKSVAAPGLTIPLKALTADDRANIALAKEYGVTGVMQPFVRGPGDLRELRLALDEAGGNDIRIFAKIESMEGVGRLEELLPFADEIVIARCDLGNAMPLWQLPAAQKRIAAVCRWADKPFMVVTQMLSSMEHSPIPTRSEVSDVFNAVLDGAASVMVTGETAVGEYPEEVVRYLVNTVSEALRFQEE
ncbi:MAG: pyruvate kinase, partial [Oscillospiraceae bacterium]|nr:pyruvate kinase [Oscillospiraceae bacterium]